MAERHPPHLMTIGGPITGPAAHARPAHPSGRVQVVSAQRVTPDVWSVWSAGPPRPVRPTVPQAPPVPLTVSGPAHAVRRRPDGARPRAGVVAVVAAVAALALGAAGWTALRADPSEHPVGATPAAVPCGVDLHGDGDLDTC